MLFDDDEQLEVRHVVSLAHHEVSIYSGGDVTPEGELFIKRNAICLSRRTSGAEIAPDGQLSKPFYLFSENCSAKEDFYFALLRNQEQAYTAEARAPAPLAFDVKHIIGLVQKLHSSEEHMQSRWLNAMIGRVFLGLYRTADIEAFIRQKLNKKISRVKRPAFLPHIDIRDINTGESAPFFTNFRHKDLTVEGECSMEADVRYTGNFRIEVAAVARIDLGGPLKARDVNLVLSVALRKLEGHILFKIKAPPSNRLWFSFSQMPRMEMTIEPIVSSRQITYTVILRQIEARIKEVIAETLVLPFWDDTPFFKTEHKKYRGGIFAGDDAIDPSMEAAHTPDLGEVDEVDTVDAGTAPNSDLPPMEKSHSMPNVDAAPTTGLFGLKLGGKPKQSPLTTASSSVVDLHANKDASTNAKTDVKADTKPDVKIDLKTDVKTSLKAEAASTSIDAKDSHVKQRLQRSSSLVVESTPVVGTENVNANVFKPSSPSGESPAASAMAKLSARTKTAPPTGPTFSSPHRESNSSTHSMPSSKEDTDKTETLDEVPELPRRRAASPSGSQKGDTVVKGSPTPSLNGSIKSQNGSFSRGLFTKKEGTADSGAPVTTGSGNMDAPNKRISLAAVSNAAGVAKRWGWNALHRNEAGKSGSVPEAEVPELDLSKPMGGGRPLPPPGMPLPMPDKKKATAIPVPKRKPLPPPDLPDKHANTKETKDQKEGQRRAVPPPPLPRRRRQTDEDAQAQRGEDMLVVAAPLAESEPTTPTQDRDEDTVHAFPSIEQTTDDSVQNKRPGSSNINATTPPSLPSRTASDPSIISQPEGNGEDDEFSAWMDNTGEDEPSKSFTTNEGLTS